MTRITRSDSIHYSADSDHVRVDDEHLLHFFDLSLDLLCLARFDGYFQRVNPAWTRLLGWSEQDLTSRPWLDFVHVDDRAATSNARQQLVDGRVVIRFANRYRSKKGDYRWLDWTAYPQQDSQIIYGIARDITEQKLASEQLAIANRQLVDARYALDQHSIVAVTDSTGTIIDVNEKFVAVSGYSRDELIGNNHRIVNSGHHSPEFFTDLWRTISSGKVWKGEICNRNKCGALYWVQTTITPFLGVDGKPLQYIAIRTDITDRKLQEAALSAHRKRLIGIFEAMGEGMVVQDMDGAILECNSAAEKILGLNADQIAGRKSLDPRWRAIHEDGSPFPGDSHPSMQVLRSGIAVRGVMMGVHKPDGSLVWISINAEPLMDEVSKHCGVVCTFIDVTDRLNLEKQLIQAQKLEAIGTLAGGIAHDFNNILGAVQGYTQLAKTDTAALPEVQGYLAAVLQGTRRASELVKQIIAFTRTNTAHPVPVKLHDIVDEALKLLRATIPATIEINSRYTADVPMIMADPTQIHQIILNMCTNAWHAMRLKSCGQLSVSVQAVQLRDEELRQIPDLEISDVVCLSISDTGAGMDGPTLQRIFEPFFTTKPPGLGSGMGLAVVHGIVKNHRGAIRVNSVVEQGTTFELYFPAYRGDGRGLEIIVDSPIPLGSGQHILFVDDELPLVNFGSAVLNKLGYQVHTYTEPSAAIAALKANPGLFDLVVTDFAMPRMSGLSLAEQLRAINKHLPIILVSGYMETLVSPAAERISVDRVLTKPYTVETLALAVHHLLNQQTEH